MYHAASSSPSHTAHLLLHSSIRRVQHSVIESVVYCTTSSSSFYSTRQQSERFRQRETGGVPGREEGVIERNKMAGRGGPFGGHFGAPYPRGGPPQGGPPQSGQAGGPLQGGQVAWDPQAVPRGTRWGPPMVPRPRQQQQPRFSGQQQPGFAGQQQPGFAGQQQSGFNGQQQPGFIGPAGAQGWQVS